MSNGPLVHQSTHRYILEPYRGPKSRYLCPNCRRRNEFTRYLDTETNQYLGEQVGKCNRENKCGYHLTPKTYFQLHPQVGKLDRWRQSNLWQTTYQQAKPQPIDFLPRNLLKKTYRGYENNNFVRYLTQLFGAEKALQLARQFHLGTSKHWRNDEGLAVVFWQVDQQQRVRQAKVMAYHPETGRRLKAEDPADKFHRKHKCYYPDTRGGAKIFFAGKSLIGRSANLQQCIFGEHQLPDRPEATVAIVESEKTAVIMSGVFPDAVWLATGGTNGARWTDSTVYSALKGRQVIFYPDLGAFRQWADKAKVLATVCDVFVSDLLEEKAAPPDREAGFDLADFFVKKNIPGGPGGRHNVNSVTPPELEKGRRECAVGMDAELAVADELPPGWYREKIRDRFGNDCEVLLDEDGLPAVWNMEPNTELERMAISKELGE